MPVVRVTVVVNITDCPNTDGFAEEATVVVVVVLVLKVAVITGELPVTLKLQGLVVEVHPVKLVAALHPVKKEPPLAVAVNVPVASLSLKVIDTHVLVNIHEVMLVFVPPQAVGTLKVPE